MSHGKWLVILLVTLGLVRFLSLGLYPLADTTEARYGEIARLMAETGDWITPQIAEGLPFWGKPPLSTWLSAASMKLFGIHEFAARFPSLLLALAVTGLVWLLAKRQRDRWLALMAVAVLASSALFFVSAGAVMTDPSLLLGTTLCMVAFWQAMHREGRSGHLWGYGFFVGLAVGMLAKGPLALVLVALPLGAWTLLRGEWRAVGGRLPWPSGLALAAALSVPWYLLAEFRTPGFLDYFLVGEHWRRFLDPGWQGDLYGNAHSHPRGTIWLYWLVCALPWSLILPARLLKREERRRLPLLLAPRDGWVLYLALWATAPMIFFTLAGNILPTYVLPGLPAFALLAAELLLHRPHLSAPMEPCSWSRALPWGVASMLLLFTAASAGVTLGYGPAEKSQKELLAAFRAERGEAGGGLVYLFDRPYSGGFYSRGSALVAKQISSAEAFLGDGRIDYFAIRKDRFDLLPPSFASRLTNLGGVNRYYLLRENAPELSTIFPAAQPGTAPRFELANLFQKRSLQ